MIDFSWITPDLAIGGCFATTLCEALATEHRIRGVVDLRAEARDEEVALRRHGLELLHLPTLDHAAVAPEMLRSGVAFAARHLDAGGRVLIHCQHGIGRSGLLGLCVLVDRGMAPLAAILRRAAVAGLGIAVLPTFMAASDLAAGRLTIVLTHEVGL